jgi:hypothetical protein
VKRRPVVPVLAVVNGLLAAVLVWMWVGTDGKLRNTQWTPPKPIRPDFSAPLAALAQRRGDEVGQLVAMADRPLFSPTRRPPPPPAPPAPPDPLANLQLLGVYNSASGGGIIARVDGRVRRASVNEKIGEWTVQKIADRDVTFVRGSESRVLQLARRGPAASTNRGLPAAAAPGTPAPAPTQMTGAQRAEEEERARLRAINENNIRNGLPPLTHR